MNGERHSDWLRERFQSAIGNQSLEPWCMTEPEAEELLSICSGHVGTAMQSMKNIATFLRREREMKAMFYTEDETLELLRKECLSLFSRGAKHGLREQLNEVQT